MLKGLCAVAAALTMSCLASADAGDTLPDHQYFPGTDPWTTPDFHLPKKREWPDGPNKEFLKNLQRPDNYKNPWRDKHSQLCCDAGDTVKTKFKVEPGEGLHPEDRWYALINGQWKPVPPDKIVPSYAPDGHGLCRPGKYQFYSCEQLAGQRTYWAGRELELKLLMDPRRAPAAPSSTS